MTDDATDDGRAAEAATGDFARHVDPALLGDIAARQLAQGVHADHPFLLVDLDDDGLRVGVVDPRTELMTERRVPAIRPAVLDQLLADHLVRTGRVAEPATETWTAELIELAARARARLATADGTFIMGRAHVKFFRVALRDLDQASAGLVAEVARIAQERASAMPGGVTSVVLGPGHGAWPGLPVALGQRTAVPVVAVEARAASTEQENQHDSGDEVPIVVPDAETNPARVAADAPSAASEPFATPDFSDADGVIPGADDTPTQPARAIEPDTEPQPVLPRVESGDFPVTRAVAARGSLDLAEPIPENIAAQSLPDSPGSMPSNPPMWRQTNRPVGESHPAPPPWPDEDEPRPMPRPPMSGPPSGPPSARSTGWTPNPSGQSAMPRGPESRAYDPQPQRSAGPDSRVQQSAASHQPPPTSAPNQSPPDLLPPDLLPPNQSGRQPSGSRPTAPYAQMPPPSAVRADDDLDESTPDEPRDVWATESVFAARESDDPGQDAPPTPRRRLRRPDRKRLLIGAVALCAVLVVGVSIALAVSGGDSSSQQSEDMAGGATSSTSSTYADPADWAEARVPAAVYTPPPPPPETTDSETGTTTTEEQRRQQRQQQQQQQPQRRAPAPPRLPQVPRTFPNPIPGLPPIVLP
ncbi:hypothetical protein AAFP35_25490 [Gordonia sp. CPCC 206044]|uniref:hypothetical protein n=1 Tax=Gordonia sp. CPCC 206044 TaxID=3140793 RepID=UPI003AF3EE4A